MGNGGSRIRVRSGMFRSSQRRSIKDPNKGSFVCFSSNRVFVPLKLHPQHHRRAPDTPQPHALPRPKVRTPPPSPSSSDHHYRPLASTTSQHLPFFLTLLPKDVTQRSAQSAPSRRRALLHPPRGIRCLCRCVTRAQRTSP